MPSINHPQSILATGHYDKFIYRKRRKLSKQLYVYRGFISQIMHKKLYHTVREACMCCSHYHQQT